MPDSTDETDLTSYKQLSALIDEWIPYQEVFTADDADRQFNIQSRQGKISRWKVLEDRVKKGILEKTGKVYRYVDNRVEEIDWKSANTGNSIDLVYPFDLHNWIKIFPHSIIVIAGASGAGKTAFMYDFILRNMCHPLGMTLFTNDMGPEEMGERFTKFEKRLGIQIPSPPPFKVFERYENFADVIRPDGINVIDYLDMNSEVYLIGAEIDKIHQKLRNGIALVGIQKKANPSNPTDKNPRQALGLGGMFSLKRAKLYLSMDHNILTIEKARSRAYPNVDPKGKTFRFKLIEGCEFRYE